MVEGWAGSCAVGCTAAVCRASERRGSSCGGRSWHRPTLRRRLQERKAESVHWEQRVGEEWDGVRGTTIRCHLGDLCSKGWCLRETPRVRPCPDLREPRVQQGGEGQWGQGKLGSWSLVATRSFPGRSRAGRTVARARELGRAVLTLATASSMSPVSWFVGIKVFSGAWCS